MGRPIDRITIKGFKSIADLDQFALRNLNVLIGANGAGKSNFVDYFRMLRAFADEAFQQYVLAAGGGDGFFFLGPKVTPEITSRIEFSPNSYEFKLIPTASGSLQIALEMTGYQGSTNQIGTGNLESELRNRKDDTSPIYKASKGINAHVYDSVSSWTIYHFHDTSPLAPMRRDQSVRDWEHFRHDASNIASFLYRLTRFQRRGSTGSYQLIRDTVRLIAPFFDDFLLRPQVKGSNELVRLEWKQKGSDFPFQPSQLSDGTIRFICLATALLQPNLPATIIIDEPELGLHPYALSVLADLIKSAAERTQVIISTQSPTLLDHFEPEEIIVVNRDGAKSTFERLDLPSLTEWMKDYSVGELWQKNVVRGGPTGE